MNKKVKILIGVAIALIPVWYIASPYLALYELRHAAEEQDRSALIDMIDFPAVRESLKSQIRASIAAKPQNLGLAVIGMAVGSDVGDHFIDSLITPDGIIQAVYKKEHDPVMKNQKSNYNIEYKGLNRVRVFLKKEDDSEKSILTFDRNGFGWKLVDVEIPLQTLQSINW